MSLWQDITKTAILGTQREAWALPAADGTIAPLLAGLSQKLPSGEAALLSAAGALDALRRAGYRAAADNRTPTPCPEELNPCCSTQAGSYLARMLSGEHAQVLGEFLSALRRVNKLVPPQYLPDLLNLAESQRELRPMLAEVGGKRGLWLAAQNERWSFLAGDEALEDWETAPKAARAALLRRMRETDAAAARETLTKSWEQEAHEDRAEFVAVLEVGLSPEDEPFLENALDDRRKEVRQAAAKLLSRMPGSAFCQRMQARLEGLLSFDPGEKGSLLKLKKGRQASITVTLPESCDKAMVRDGIEAKPPSDGRKLGEKAWWLLQMLGAVPPSTWSARWQRTPAEVVQLAQDHEWHASLINGWALAAAHHRDEDWAAALLSQSLTWLAKMAPLTLANLAAVLPPQTLEQLTLQQLHAECNEPWRYDSASVALLRACRHPWSAALTSAAMQSAISAQRMMEQTMLEVAYPLATCMHPQAALDTLGLMRERYSGDNRAPKRYDDLMALLTFRRDCIAAATA